jgi:type IX secretion system PorP/SprF family membrane protein
MKTSQSNMYICQAKGLLMFFVIAFTSLKSNAQLNPMGSAYFSNQYLVNPAMAGLKEQLNLTAAIRQQFSNVPGSPLSQAFTADYGFTSRAAVALLVYNDRSGVLQNTHASGTFAYHLPLSANDKLSFGISLGVANDQINKSEINGNINDPDLMDVNRRETYIDGDFGTAYTRGGFQVQIALPNMKRLFDKDNYEVADQSVFFSAISYRLTTGLGILEPKIAYRGIKGYHNIFDGGANLELEAGTIHKLNLFGIYHSSRSATIGIGMNWNNSFSFNGMYTTSTSPLQGYTNGDFELSISLSLFKR